MDRLKRQCYKKFVKHITRSIDCMRDTLNEDELNSILDQLKSKSFKMSFNNDTRKFELVPKSFTAQAYNDDECVDLTLIDRNGIYSALFDAKEWECICEYISDKIKVYNRSL